MRIVIDTNIFVSYLITPGGLLNRLIETWVRTRSLEVYTSEWQIDELKRVCGYDRIKDRVSPKQVQALVTLLRRHAVIVAPRRVPRVSPDRDDDYVIAIALEANTSALVSGDNGDLLVLKTVQGVSIITPRVLLGRLKPKKKRLKDPKGLVAKTKKPAKKR